MLKQNHAFETKNKNFVSKTNYVTKHLFLLQKLRQNFEIKCVTYSKTQKMFTPLR